MYDKRCWYCDSQLSCKEEEIFDCPECGMENDLTTYTPLTENKVNKEEVNMPFEKEGESKDVVWLKMPLEGKSYDFTPHGAITAIIKVDNVDHKKGKFNFMKKVEMVLPNGNKAKVDEDCGYYYRIEFSDGAKMTISSWSPYFAMTRANICEGSTMKVNHKAKGEWEIERIPLS